MDTTYLQYNSGWEGEKLVAPNKAYTTAANYAAFAANDADGNFGIFKSDGTLVTGGGGAGNIAAGDKIFFALKRDLIVDKTTLLTPGLPGYAVVKTTSTSAVNQVTTVVISCGGTTDCADPNSCCTNKLQNYFMGYLDPQTSDRMQKDTWEYYVQGNPTKKIIDVLNHMRTLFNDDASQMNKVRGRRVTMSAITSGGAATSADPATYTFTLTSTTPKAFKFLIKGFASYTVTETTKAVEATGTVKMMKQLELEGLIREGWDTKYIGDGQISAEWGEPTMFAASTASPLFTQYLFNEDRTEVSNISGVERHYRKHLLEIAVPTGSALETKMNLVFSV